MNVASVTNHFPTANKGFITTLGSTILSGATTVPLTSVSGLTNGTIFVGIIEPGQAKEQEFTGTVDTAGVQITGVKWTDGTNVDHTAGVTIVDYVSATGQNMQTKGLLVEHGQDGKHTAITATTVTTSGNIQTTAGAVITDTISEATAAKGVAIDGMTIKDGKVVGGAAVGVNNTSLDTTAGEPGGAWKVWSPSLTGWSSNPTGGLYYYTKVGKSVTLMIAQPNNGTSNATTCSFTLPENAVTRAGCRWNAAAEVADNGLVRTAPGVAVITSGGTVVTVALDFGYNAFTTSGNKRVINCVITYEVA